MSQLSDYMVRHDRTIAVGRKTFRILHISGEGDLAVAAFQGPRARFHVVRCLRTRVIGRPTAEVWSIIPNGRSGRAVDFAVDGDEVVEVS
ncbi:MAG TPA: hypothetical protein VF178_04185 [Gemmatimonadaceae bacterium]